MLPGPTWLPEGWEVDLVPMDSCSSWGRGGKADHLLDPICRSLVWSTPNLSSALCFVSYLHLENPSEWDTGIPAHTCNHITGDQVRLP